MSKTLAGVTFAYNAIEQDYHIIETLESLAACCDKVAVAAGGTDGTMELVRAWVNTKENVWFYGFDESEWQSQQGREKLSHFSNIAIQMIESMSDYILYVQADEVISERSFETVRAAMETDQNAFLCHRINLWSSPYTALRVTPDRLPVSEYVIRLAKSNYRCVGDAESLGGNGFVLPGYADEILIYHTGFVRDKHKHLVKIRHMQEKVFLFDQCDQRVNDCPDGFDPWRFGFTPADVEPISEPLPRFVTQWAKEREYDPFSKLNDAKLWLSLLEGAPLIGGFSDDHVIQLANKLWWKLVKSYQ